MEAENWRAVRLAPPIVPETAPRFPVALRVVPLPAVTVTVELTGPAVACATVVPLAAVAFVRESVAAVGLVVKVRGARPSGSRRAGAGARGGGVHGRLRVGFTRVTGSGPGPLRFPSTLGASGVRLLGTG